MHVTMFWGQVILTTPFSRPHPQHCGHRRMHSIWQCLRCPPLHWCSLFLLTYRCSSVRLSNATLCPRSWSMNEHTSSMLVQVSNQWFQNYTCMIADNAPKHVPCINKNGSVPREVSLSRLRSILPRRVQLNIPPNKVTSSSF